MEKTISRIKLVLISLVLLLMLAGCERKSEELNGEIKGECSQEETTAAMIQEAELEDYEDNEIMQEAVSENRMIDLTDYSSYLKKIWIVDGWEDEEPRWDFPISLVFTKTEEGVVEGYFYMGGMISTNYFRILINPNMPQFRGMVYDGTAECEYDVDDGGKGTFSLTFCGNDRIEAKLGEDENQSYTLRPYNISDEKFRDNQTSYEVEVDSWGTVNLFYANTESNYSVPVVYFIDEQGDIIYQFSAAYQTESEVLEVIIEDMNGDGLKDVEVVTYFSDIPDVYRFEWYFYQEEDGFFYFGLSKMFGE